MKKGVIITNAYYYGESTANQVARLQSEFLKIGNPVDWIDNSTLPALINDNVIFSKLTEYDFAIYLDKDPHIALMLEKSGLKLFNSAESIRLCDDKILTNIILANNNIKIPTTISSPLMYKGGDNKNMFNVIESAINYPMIIKEAHGSLGAQVYLVNDRIELLAIRNKIKLRAHLYQEFISSSWGKDMRVILIGGQVVASYMRKSELDFRSNIELGAEGILVDIEPEYARMAEQVAKILDLDYCGVDLLFGKDGEPILCEVNSNAFFLGAEKYTGNNIAEKYVKYILSVLDDTNLNR